MTEYALVRTSDDTILKTRDFKAATPPNLSHKGWEWRAITRDPVPAYDPATQYIDPTVTVGASSVTYGWDVVSKTAQEQNDEKELRIDSEEVLVAFAKVIRDELNIIRALAALPARNLTQLRNAIKGYL